MDRKTLSNQRGFTLAEIMVVVVIIGLLAGLILPKVLGRASEGRIKTTKAQIELLGQALDQYKLDTGKYPSTQEGLQALLTNPGVERWNGAYLKKNIIPKDAWEKEYHYQSPGSHGDYDLLSYGRDGSQGGEGEDKDIVSWE